MTNDRDPKHGETTPTRESVADGETGFVDVPLPNGAVVRFRVHAGAGRTRSGPTFDIRLKVGLRDE